MYRVVRSPDKYKTVTFLANLQSLFCVLTKFAEAERTNDYQTKVDRFDRLPDRGEKFSEGDALRAERANFNGGPSSAPYYRCPTAPSSIHRGAVSSWQ